MYVGKDKRKGITASTRRRRKKGVHPWAHRSQTARWRKCKFNQCRAPHKETKYRGHCSTNCQNRKQIKKDRGYQFDLGHSVRSGWERKYSDWLRQMGFVYHSDYNRWAETSNRTRNYYFYEPKRFLLGGGVSYLPDFYMSKTDTWVEVKGYMTKKDEIKIKKFREAGHRLIIVDKKFFNSKYFKS